VLAEIKQLLALQDVDGQIADVESRLARLQRERKRFDEQIEAARAAFAAVQADLAKMEHDSRMLNLEVDELDMQIRDYQKRLDEGIISFKEMENLRTKIELEHRRMNEQEDEALNLMDSIEAQTEAVVGANETLRTREAELEAQIAQCESDMETAKQDLQTLSVNRQTATEALPKHLQTQYETLRKEVAAPVAEIRGGVCGGCKLRVSGNTAERARGEMGIVTCEHCSRILYAG